MRIACLQFDPELGRLPENIARANVLLEAASPQNLDLLVLPELAFTGPSSPRPHPSSQPMFSPLTSKQATTTPPSPPYCPTSNPPPPVRPRLGPGLPHPVSTVSSQSATLSSAFHLPIPPQTLKTSRLPGKSQLTTQPSQFPPRAKL